MPLSLRLFIVILAAVGGAAWIWLSFENHLQAASSLDNAAAFEKRENAYRMNNLGVAQLEQFDYKAAVQTFRNALEIEPQLTIARINLAIALFNANDTEAARKEAEIAVVAAPERLQPHYILALIARNQSRADDAIAALRRVLTVDPNDVGANINLGQIFVQQRKYPEATAVFRKALAAEPYNGTAIYNLGTVLLRTDARDEGQQHIQRFQKLRESGAATNIGQNYLEQGRYAEAIASTGAESELVDKTAPKVVFQNANNGLLAQKPQIGLEPGGLTFLKPKSKFDILRRFAGGATLFDFDNDGDLDLAKLDNSIGAARKPLRQVAESTATVTSSIALYRNDAGKFVDATTAAGDLIKPGKNVTTTIVAGDFDNDNLPDLFVAGYDELKLFRNTGAGKFIDVSSAAKMPKYPYLSISAAFVDADHDGDLDIFVAGFVELDQRAEVNDFMFPQEFSPAPNLLLRNNGDGTFADISEAAKINASKGKTETDKFEGRSLAVVPTDYDNRRDVDFLVLNYNGKPNLYRNLRDGSFRDVAAEVGLNKTGVWTCAAAGDFNKDSFTDFFFGKSNDVGVLAVSDGRGKFVMQDAPPGTEDAASAQFLDYDNDGLLDLVVNGKTGFVVARNLGNAWTNADSSAFKIKTGASNALAGSRQMLSGDLDRDGDVDLLAFAPNGRLHFVQNVNDTSNKSVTVTLQGRFSNRVGIGAKIDLRAGSLAQKLESYAASPAPAPSDVHFGLGKHIKPDAVRVIWTSGVVQAETEISSQPQKQIAGLRRPLKIEELDRKPSSCPYLYTWNGERFEFVTDFLGGGEMGNWKEAGVYHHPDSDEFVRIAPEQLKPRDGRYELRVTNELEEVLFLDDLKLIAVEHDADREVYPNEGLGIPAAGQRILYTTSNASAPLVAVDSNGQDVLPKVKDLDRKFYDNFKSLNIRGYAQPHELTLKLDHKKDYHGRTLLLLTGWTDYAFSSDNLAASQSGKSLFLPRLQVKNRRGEWQTVIERIGISVGRPQTLVVDLTGKFLSDSREVRIVTNFKTYWDKIAVDTSEQTAVKTTQLQPAQADLRERGFSEEIKYGEMIAVNYDRALDDNRWKHFSGDFTRLGDVKSLLTAVDDVFVISKTGDELVLSFPALPELPANRKRTFLLFADGYSKEMDINSGSPDAVLPLPFKQMSKYPYNTNETTDKFPMTEGKQRIYDEYTTRRVKTNLPRIGAVLEHK